MGSLRVVLEALRDQIAIEVARPANSDGSGGTSFAVEVLLGNEQLSKLPAGVGRVVLGLHEDGDDQLAPGKQLNAALRSLYTWQPALAASLWAPVGTVGERAYLDRLDAIEALTRCVLRAIHEQFHGAGTLDLQIASAATVSRSARHLKHGEASVVLFSVGVPITKGQNLQKLPPGSRLAVTMNVNPES